MSCDGAGLGELPVADVAPEWFLPRVGPAVGRQVGRLAEGLVALRAPDHTNSQLRVSLFSPLTCTASLRCGSSGES